MYNQPTLYKPRRNYLYTEGGLSNASKTAPYFTMQEELLRFLPKKKYSWQKILQCSAVENILNSQSTLIKR